MKELENETKNIHTRKINSQSVTVRRINGTEGQTETDGRAWKNEIRNTQNEVPVLLVHVIG